MATMRLRLRELLTQRENQLDRRIRLNEVAQETGISANTLTAMINNQSDRVSLQALAKLCEYFHCTPGELFRYSAEPEGIADVIDARDIVRSWEQQYGADEHPPR
ncbi:MAG TPA: helix-turn-helix transcriptional regulator [Herpetosiphonaceae bacterium]